MMLLLEAKDIAKSFRNSPWSFLSSAKSVAVSNVSLQLGKGEVIGIVGESGCGKSTLARLLAGVLTVDSGEVKLAGKDLRDLSRLQKAQSIQMMFQDPGSSLHPRIKIIDAMNEVLQSLRGLTQDLAKDEVHQLLRQLDLPAEILQRFPHQLSGGQKQRVTLMRALALRPSILICDEPLTALDRITQSRVLALLQRLRKDPGLAMIFISHDFTTVRALADHVAVMYAGQWVESGLTVEVLERPKHPYTRYLLQSLPKLYRQELPRIPDFSEESPVPTQGCPLTHRCPYAKSECRSDSSFKTSPLVMVGTRFSSCIRQDLF